MIENARRTDLVEPALNVQLGVLGLPVLQLDRDLLLRGEVRGDVDLAEGAAAELAAQAEAARYSDVHLTCTQQVVRIY